MPMSAFEFIFSLFGLLLGLSLAEVIGGLARWVEVRRSVRIGWLTPLLGILLVIDLTSFWAAAWRVRDYLTFSIPALLGGVCFAGGYYMAAYLVFPRRISAETDLDEHYFRVRRIVVGIVIAANTVEILLLLWIPRFAQILSRPDTIARLSAFYLLLIASLFVRGKKASATVLGVLVGLYFLDLMGVWGAR
jgi:hypothetical protein